MVSFQEIKNHLGITDEQAQRFSKEVELLENLQHFFKKYPEEGERFKEQLLRAEKALQYRQPYRIAVIGTTGAGKSTLINALLGRELVLTKAVDKPATGTALRIFLDVLGAEEPEEASAEYRNEADIRQLIGCFIERYKLEGSGPTGRLDKDFSQALESLEPKQDLDGAAAKEFKGMRDTLADMVKQYANNNPNSLKHKFSLSDKADVKALMELIDENSEKNGENSPFRQIGLVKSVTYHIHPQGNSEGLQALQLPNNVCLVDLPGLDGSTFHDLIITEGIRGADAVIFILRPPRLLSGGDSYLLENVRKYISLEGSVESGERIFIVLNAKDSIMADQIPANLPQNMQNLIESIVPGYTTHPYLAKRGGDTPYFLTSAWAALQAQKALQKMTIEDPSKYRTVKIDLGAENGSDRQVLEASQIPKLVAEVTQFARERLIEGQIREGKRVLTQIVATLRSEYESQLQQLTQERGAYYFQDKMEQALKEREKKLRKLVINFRQGQEKGFPERRRELEARAARLCDQIDNLLKEKMPQLWQENAIAGQDPLTFQETGQVNYPPFLGYLQIFLWQQLTRQMPELAKYLVQGYEEQWSSSRLAGQIAQNCYDCEDSQTLESEVHRWIDQDMRPSLKAIASRLPLTKMAAPSQYLLPQTQEIEQGLLQIKNGLPRPELPKPDDFNPLVTLIRKHYQPFIGQDSLEELLNVYRYEMILVEDQLLKRISEIFRGLLNGRDPALQEKIRASIADPEVGRAELLTNKLRDLPNLSSG